MNKIKYLLLIYALLSSYVITAQNDSTIIFKEHKKIEWNKFVEIVESQSSYKFYFENKLFKDVEVEVNSGSRLFEVLNKTCQKLELHYICDEYNNIIISQIEIKRNLSDDFFSKKKKLPKEEQSSQVEQPLVKKQFVAKTITIGNKRDGMGKKNVTLSGIVSRAEDNTSLIGATIYIVELQKGTTCNENGYFEILLPKGKYTIQFHSIECEQKEYTVKLLSSGSLNVSLAQKVYELDAVEIKSDKIHNVRSAQMGYEKITSKKLKELPMVLGEQDVIKVALLLPGVQSVGEGSGGYNVRGAPADQNLFYINNLPVYNTSHLLGFFSAFNPDAINAFTLYKGYIPAQYGGRLSSVFDIQTKSGDTKKFKLKGGISPISARLMMETPIKKDKGSILIAARTSYSDWVLKRIDDPEISSSSANFLDFVADLSFNISPKDQISAFVYHSADDLNISSRINNSYSNLGGSLSYMHLFGNNADLNIKLIRSQYDFSEENEGNGFDAYKFQYQLSHNEVLIYQNLNIKDKHSIRAGLSSIYYDLHKGDYEPLEAVSNISPIKLGNEQALSSSFFINDEWKLSDKFSVNMGIRLNHNVYLGEQDVYSYSDGAPRTIENIVDTTHYNAWDPISTYITPDIRIAAKYAFNDDISIKMGYNKLQQNIFMLSNTISISPTHKWKLADSHLKPMQGHQVSFGFYSNMLGEMYELSTEFYVKRVNNQVEFKDGADLLINEIPETDILQGYINAYGAEFMIKKVAGKLNGWINYTYSNARVLVNNTGTGEQINFGNEFPANYDKPHAFNIVANYRLNRRVSFSGNIVYSTGRPITYPTAIYYQNGKKILNYSLRNEYRLPDYFRADLSMNLEGNLLAKKLAHSSFSLSVYNLTGRKNAYSVYFENVNGQIQGYKLSVFGTQIYSISYNIKLGNYEN